MNKLLQYGLAATAALVSLGITIDKPILAASFVFDLAGKGQGSLSFQNSPLSGMGNESISLEELSNLAEDVNFTFSFPTYGQYAPYEQGDTDYADYLSSEIKFNFANGQLSGISLRAGFGVEYQPTVGGTYLVNRSQTLFVENDRFFEFLNINEFSAGPGYCENEIYYYDDQPEQGYEAEVCYYDYYRVNENYEIQAEGISYQKIEVYGYRIIYYVEELSDVFEKNDPNYSDKSDFIRFDELPQVTFRTLKSINPDAPGGATSIPEPQPFTILGLTTAMAGGILLKQLKPRKKVKLS